MQRVVQYVAKVLETYDEEVKVSFLRKSLKFDGKFLFLEVEEVKHISKRQILMRLPPPEQFRQTKRQQNILSFQVDFSNYQVR